MNLSWDIPYSVGTTFNDGRLGNQLSSFATLYSVWREFNIYNFIGEQEWAVIVEVFDLPTVDVGLESNNWPYFIRTTGKIYVSFIK